MKARSFAVFVLIVGLVFLVIPRTTIAGGPPMARYNIELLAQVGGTPYTVTVQDSYAYVGVGPNLFILNVANPTAPQTVGRLLLPDIVRGVAIAGNYAYIGDRWSCLRIVDISDPANPLEVGSWEACGWAHGIAVGGGYAYLATMEGLAIVDVTDPIHPVYVGRLDTIGYGQHVALRGNYAYYADGSAGLRVVNVSNPTTPVEVGRCDTLYAEDVAVSGNYAYVASNKEGGLLKVVDVSDPASPHQVASYDTPGMGTSAVDVSDNYVFLATLWGSSTELGVRIIDISNPLTPHEVGFYDIPDAQDVAVAGSYAYVTCQLDGGMRVVNVSQPTSPTEVGRWGTLGSTGGVATAGNYAYIAHAGTVLIIDATDPTHPSVVGSLPWSFRDFEVTGSYAFVASGDLRILDISDPTNPTDVSTFDVPSYINRLARVGQYVYLAEQGWWNGSQYTGGGLRIVDVSNISSPQQVGYLSMPGYVQDIAVTSEHAYMVYREEGLRIIDVSDPTNPVQIGSIASQNYDQAVAAAGDYVYWGDGWSPGLRIFDVSNPAQPIQVGSIFVEGGPQGMVVVGSYVFVDNNRGMVAVDVSIPTNPAIIAYYGTVGDSTSGRAVAGNLAYVTSRQGGMFILRLLRDEASGIIDTGGGNLSSTSGDTELSFPAGTVTDTVRLIYRHLLFDEDTIGSLVGIGHTFDLTAVYSDTGKPAQTVPGRVYTVTVQYTDAEKGPAIEDTLALYYWDGTQWIREPSSVVDTVANTVTAQLSHFSKWAVLGETKRVYLPLIFRNFRNY